MFFKRQSAVTKWAVLIAEVLLACVVGSAQTTGLGTISGTVADSAGGVVPGAKITVTNIATGVVRSAVSNDIGYYEVNALIAGSYRISAAHAGFRETCVTEAQDRQLVGWDPGAALPIAAAGNAAYQSFYNGLPANQRAVMPSSVTFAGGPLYAGLNGATNKQSPNNGRFLPRIAIAYKLTPNTVIRAGYGRFADTLNATVPSLLQPGYSVSTSVPSSTSYGTNFDINNRPLMDPFPMASGTRFNTPIGNSLGTSYYLGGGSPGNVYDNVVPPTQNRVSLTVQRQFGRSMVLEATAAGAWTKNLIIGQPITSLPASLYTYGQQPNAVTAKVLSTQVTNPFNISNFASLQVSNPALYTLMAKNSFFTAATQSLSALARPLPWMGGFSVQRSIGETTFHQLQLNLTRKFSQGLTFVTGLQLNDQRDRDWFANSFDTAPSWEPSNTSRPYRITAQTVWELPVGRGRKFLTSGFLSKVLGGFQLNFTYEYQPGPMINFGNLFYIGDPNNMLLSKPIYTNALAAGGSDYVQ